MTTDKTPVYWRTNDGRKVVIVQRCADNTSKIMCYSPTDCGFVYHYEDELTPWVEPETRTTYLHWFKSNDEFQFYSESMKDIGNGQEFKAIKKITITEGEFDE